MARMTADGTGSEELGDCVYCQSAGSVRAGRCQICEWEARAARPVGVEVPPARTRRDDGTLTATGG